MNAITDLEDLHVRREGAAGRITLNRPKALNSLTLDMVHSFATALDGWAEDDSVRVVVIDGAGTRGLCAGGDVRALNDSGSRGDGMAETFWRDEYRLNAAIGELSEAGRGVHGRHRHGRRCRHFRACVLPHRH